MNYIEKEVKFLIFLVVICVNICYSERYLYDLSIDPTESTNLIENNEYATKIELFEERLDYWSKHLKQADISGTKNLEYTLENWGDCSCVRPWVDGNYVRDLEQIHFPENPPHIVFVLVDDFGWNDIGYQSTYQSWATPAIDLLASEGIKLSNYFTHDSCAPSRGALMTGRFSVRLGFQYDTLDGAELRLDEITLAEELKTAGYRTNHVGKWHLGMSSTSRLPNNRGFDYSYGYYNGYIDYYTKEFNGYFDLHENGYRVNNEDEISTTLHSAYLFQQKAESVIQDHAINYPENPMFLYYALQLTHFPFEPPSEYSDRCYSLNSESQSFCGMTLMLDEIVANLTCSLRQHGMMDNTVLIFASDNGGVSLIPSNSVPFRGHKFSFNRGGISAHAFIHSNLIPADYRGRTYDGLMHVTDWLPTIMHVATEGKWEGSYIDNAIDGVDMWNAILFDEESPKTEIVHYHDGQTASISIGNLKYDVGLPQEDYDTVDYITTSESSNYNMKCSSVSLMNDKEFVIPFYQTEHHNSNSQQISSIRDSINYAGYISLFALFSLIVTVVYGRATLLKSYERVPTNEDYGTHQLS